jgi:hypothetical protein
MVEEFIYEREEELIDYFRNNLTDPDTRGTDVVDESFTATASQTVFTLANTEVKNVADTITVEGVTKRKGRDYVVSYGQGVANTTVTLKVGATVDDEILISYHYGDSMISREFAKDNTTTPRVIMMFLTGSEEFAGLGDALEDGTGSYFNATYRFEIRARYPGKARRIASQVFNLGKKARHANLHRLLITQSRDLGNFGYDRDKEVYIWQFSLDLQWDMIFV